MTEKIPRPRRSHRYPRGHNGAILVLVLGLFLLMAVLATRFLEAAYLRMRAEALQAGKDELRATAYSALQASLAVIHEYNEIDGGLFSPAQGWRKPLAAANLMWPDGLVIEVEVVDETGKLPLDPFPDQAMRLFFEEIGIGLADGDILVDSFMDWTDPDDLERLQGAESSYYERMDPPRMPPNAPIQSYDSIRYIRGFEDLFFDENGRPNANYHAFEQATSPHHAGAVNLNTASSLVREVFARQAGFDARALDDYLAGQDRIEGTEQDMWIRSGDDVRAAGLPENIAGAGYEVRVLKITVKVASGDKSALLSAVVRVGAEAGTARAGSGGGVAGGTTDNGSAGRTPRARVLREGGQIVTIRSSRTGNTASAQNNEGNFPFHVERVAESIRMH